mmetsp:Transcript_18428/g.52207  ORF Transcript_18428/g.52207 Transcript_18428/m.52207 type:complete len:276 (+) Transcript_18428:54-881(+)
MSMALPTELQYQWMLERVAVGVSLGIGNRPVNACYGVVFLVTTIIALLGGELVICASRGALAEPGALWADAAPVMSGAIFVALVVQTLSKADLGLGLLNLAGGIASALGGVNCAEQDVTVIFGVYGLMLAGYLLARATARFERFGLRSFAAVSFSALAACRLLDLLGPVTCPLMVVFTAGSALWPQWEGDDAPDSDEEEELAADQEAQVWQEGDLKEEPAANFAAPTRTFVCPSCWAQFSAAHELLQHDKVFHNDRRGYPANDEESLLAFNAFFH